MSLVDAFSRPKKFVVVPETCILFPDFADMHEKMEYYSYWLRRWRPDGNEDIVSVIMLYFDGIYVGLKLDVFDSHDKWYGAEVIDEDEDRVFIHYDGVREME